MRTLKKLVLAGSLFLTLVTTAYSQAPEGLLVYVPDKYFYINLDINKPMTNTDWLSAVSPRGARIGYRQFITRSFSAGIDVGWASYNQYFPKETFQYPSGAITTDYFNYVTSLSVAASGQYNFDIRSKVVYPYVGIGLGALGNQYTQYYNIYTDRDNSWGFLSRGEVGALFRFSKRRGIGGMIAFHYDYANNKSEVNNYSGFSSIGVQVGLMFMDWKLDVSDSY